MPEYKEGYFKSIRVGKLFRLAGAGYETMITKTYDDDELKLLDFANSIKGTELAKHLGFLIDKEWYIKNAEDIESLKNG